MTSPPRVPRADFEHVPEVRDGHQPVAAPKAGDNTKVVLRPITNLVRQKNLDVVMIFSG